MGDLLGDLTLPISVKTRRLTRMQQVTDLLSRIHAARVMREHYYERGDTLSGAERGAIYSRAAEQTRFETELLRQLRQIAPWHRMVNAHD